MSDGISAFVFMALCRPSTVGAILPSSQRLAEAMSRAARGCSALIELGAGTGAITAALCRQHPGVPLQVVELQARLAQHLRQRFPNAEVLQAPAHHVLAQAHVGPPGLVLVSSLPFRSLPPRLRLRSSLAIEQLLIERPGSRLVQYSYLPREPFALRRSAQLHWRRLGAVWGNTPPAWVWELKSAAAPALA
jgi:phosphatidylethanolamine/phosphatidyl-N-methylethanolamine N-methyltransferase